MTKITDDELKRIREMRDIFVGRVASVGELHLQIMLMNEELRRQEEDFKKLQEDERLLYVEMEQKYGEGTINIDTGEITK